MSTQWEGVAPTPEQLEFLGLSNYGCYTFFQVREKSVRGLALHLDRLQANGRELFGQAPAETRLRELLGQAMSHEACSMRVTLVSQDIEAVLAGRSVEPEVVVTTSPPKDSSQPISVRTVGYQRETPAVKHRATYGLTRHTRSARQAGYDDALFVGADGGVSEGTAWNLLLRSEDTWLWPAADVLPGVTMQLISRAMDQAGARQVRRRVPTDDLRNAQAAFALNTSSHKRPIAQIDDHRLMGNEAAVVPLEQLWASIAAEPI